MQDVLCRNAIHFPRCFFFVIVVCLCKFDFCLSLHFLYQSVQNCMGVSQRNWDSKKDAHWKVSSNLIGIKNAVQFEISTKN